MGYNGPPPKKKEKDMGHIIPKMSPLKGQPSKATQSPSSSDDTITPMVLGYMALNSFAPPPAPSNTDDAIDMNPPSTYNDDYSGGSCDSGFSGSEY